MMGVVSVVLTCFGLLHTTFSAPQDSKPDAAAAAPPDSFKQEFLPFLKRYCVDCHGDGAHMGDFDFERYRDLEGLKRDRHAWTKALKLLKLGVMPPNEAEKPPEEERARAVKWLDHQLFYCDCSQPADPGRVTVRRLNKTEYDNTIRDLLGVDDLPADDFPADETGYGFDNIADVLSVPPLLLEKYLEAAEAVAEKAVRTHSPAYARIRYSGRVLSAEARMVRRAFDINRPGRYRVKVEAKPEGTLSKPAHIDVRFGNRVVIAVDVGGPESIHEFEAVFDAKSGRQNATAILTLDNASDATEAASIEDRNVNVSYLEVEGPLDFTEEERRAQPLVRVLPRDGMNPLDAARANLKQFLPRAFRREVTAAEIDRCVLIAQRALSEGESFDEAMKLALQGVLVSPQFLFRVEGGRRREGRVETLDDFALASRLSYFLWQSMPDEELFRLAGENRLHEREVLEQQTRRLLGDRRAEALIANFAGQWLGLRKLATKNVKPDSTLFPGFNDQLRHDLWKETELFFGSIVRSNSSIYDLLAGRYTFLNERLSRHYGIEGVTGNDFRRFDFQQEKRAGVLTQGSILTFTSHPGRTSPVKRGEWVLTNLLGDAPPEPPPSVPMLEETQAANPNLTLRQQMERHRADPGCAACHKVMDAIGFGLENFDPVGRWRDADGMHSVDSKGTLPSGETFEGPMELVNVLHQRKAQFSRCLTEKMLTYALGRGVEWFDKCAVDDILAELEKDDRFSTLILGIVKSAPFQLRRAQDSLPAPARTP